MPLLTVTEPHSLGQDAAIARLKSFGETLKAEHGDKIRDVTESWVTPNVLEFAFKAVAAGPDVHVSGTLTIEASEVTIKGVLPWRANLFKERIEHAIRENLRKALA